jgi:hypothetical protein
MRVLVAKGASSCAYASNALPDREHMSSFETIRAETGAREMCPEGARS